VTQNVIAPGEKVTLQKPWVPADFALRLLDWSRIIINLQRDFSSSVE
jgi:hypothetical protein